MAAVKCLDTYALIEISLGNPKFSEYIKEEFIITDLALAEFYAVLLREQGESTAKYWSDKLSPYSESADKEVLIEAVRFRHKHKKQKISFFDATGYVFSLKKSLKFVTGDKEFQNFSNVEYKKR